MLQDFSTNLFLTLLCDMEGNMVRKTDATILKGYTHLNYQGLTFFLF